MLLKISLLFSLHLNMSLYFKIFLVNVLVLDIKIYLGTQSMMKCLLTFLSWAECLLQFVYNEPNSMNKKTWLLKCFLLFSPHLNMSLYFKLFLVNLLVLDIKIYLGTQSMMNCLLTFLSWAECLLQFVYNEPNSMNKNTWFPYEKK